MAGHAGTPRFGTYADDHRGKPDANGQNDLELQSGDTFIEQHALFNPSQLSRAMGVDSLGAAPGKYYQHVPHLYEAMANHDGFEGGQDHIIHLDEAKVLANTVYTVPIVCADDNQNIFNSNERTA